MKFGGEGRVADLLVFYDSNKRGTFTYDGTVGPWSSLPASQASASLKALGAQRPDAAIPTLATLPEAIAQLEK